MKLYFATDHAGFELKNQLLDFVKAELHLEVVDCGASSFDAEDDFSDYIALAAEAVAQNPTEHRAVILGGSGQGEAMLANRYQFVRAAVYYGGALEIVKLSREHNDANVLSLGARFIGVTEAKQALQLWIDTDPDHKAKYQRRIDKIRQITKKMYE